MQRFIPQADPRAAWLERRTEIDAAIARVLDGGRYVLGDEVAAFEREFATWNEAGAAIGVASGTDAIEIALRALDVGPGDAVLTVSHTAVATVAAIVRAGATPVFVDVRDDTFTMDPADLERALEDGRVAAPLRPRAVVPVHLYGHPADLDPVLTVARRHGLVVVEDCAQAHGARYRGRRVGTFGDAGAFSFYPTKNLGALGDAGAVTCGDADLAARIVALRQYGWDDARRSERVGVNSRLDEVQAAVLRVKLRALDADNDRRRALADVYRAELDGVRAPEERVPAESAHHLFVIRTPARDALHDGLRREGIGSAVHYPEPVHRQPAWAPLAPERPGALAVTEALCGQILSLPLYPQLSADDVGTVCAAVQRLLIKK